MSFGTLILLSYALLAIFAVAFVLRALRLARLPIHLRWELAPVPHEKGKGHYGGSYLEEPMWWSKPLEKDKVAEGVYMFKEILFLKALFEHKRGMWYFSFPFHFGLYLLIAAGGLHPEIKARYFRVGHMGVVNASDTLTTVGAIEFGLAQVGHKFEPGAGLAAAQGVLLE